MDTDGHFTGAEFRGSLFAQYASNDKWEDLTLARGQPGKAFLQFSQSRLLRPLCLASNLGRMGEPRLRKEWCLFRNSALRVFFL